MKFSVITINLNNMDGLEKTIQSVIYQEFTDYEYIIIDGGSTDGSQDSIMKYANRIDFWLSEPDNGIYNAMNKAVAHSHGDYCIFMNSGDIFYNKNVLKNIYDRNYREDIITGVTIGKDESDIRFSTEGKVTFLTLYRNTISHQASFIKTDILRKYPYNETYKIVSDWEFWIKTIILNNCSHIFDKNIIAKIDLSGISVNNNEQREKERKMVMKKLIPINILEDYKPLKYADDNMIHDVAIISKTNSIHKIVASILRIISKLIK